MYFGNHRNNFSNYRCNKRCDNKKMLPNIVKKFPRYVITITIQFYGSGSHSIHEDDEVRRVWRRVLGRIVRGNISL